MELLIFVKVDSIDGGVNGIGVEKERRLSIEDGWGTVLHETKDLCFDLVLYQFSTFGDKSCK